MGKLSNPLKANTLREDSANISEPEEPLSTKVEAPEKKVRKPKKAKEPKKEKEPKVPKEPKPEHEQRVKVFGLSLLLIAAFLLFSFASFTQTWLADFDFANKVLNDFSITHFLKSSAPENWVGKIGAITAYFFIFQGFGIASFLFVVILVVSGLKLFFRISVFPVWKTIKIALFGLAWIPVLLRVIFAESTPWNDPGNGMFYGVYGYILNIWLTDMLGFSGLILLLGFTFMSFMILVFNIPFRWLKKNDSRDIPVSEASMDIPVAETLEELVPTVTELPPSNQFIIEEEPVIAEEKPVIVEENPVMVIEESPMPAPTSPPPPFLTPVFTPIDEVELQIESPVEEKVLDDEVVSATVHNTIDTRYDPTLDLPHFKFPPLELLSDYGGDEININKEELEANKNRIVDTLNIYAIKIQKIKATIGPAVTLYEIVPEAGVRISRIKNLEDDIALSLSAMGIRIIAPIPGKGTIGIEVPNQNPETVSIKSLLSSERFQKSGFELPLVLGKTIANETFIVDLAKMPHILMAGATGQGKSVGLNTIITSLLYKKHPSQIKFVMVDPKKVELSLFSKIERHYLAKLPDSEEAIITDTKKVIRTLNSLNIEMDSRYDLLQDAQVRNIKEYNEKFLTRKLNPNNGHHFLPYLILVVDEFADLIMTAGREIETPLTRLAQLARAVGIHLIIATQRPSVNIITGTIKANFPARIAFRVISKIDSRTILDTGGADQLIGRGDMLLSTGSDVVRLQCAFVDTPEIERITDYIGSQKGFSQAYALPEFNDEESDNSKEFDPESRDELFAEAARLIVQHQQGSTSLIQRKLKLGYNRAGRIIDQLESAGIVGPFEGSKAREVRYKDLTSLEMLLKDMGEN